MKRSSSKVVKLTLLFLRLRAEAAHDSLCSPPPTSRLFTCWTGLLCVRIRSLWSFLQKQRPLPLLILPTTLRDPSSSSRSWPAEGCRRSHSASQKGLAKIHRAACQNVDAKRTNVRSEVTLKGKRVFGPRQKWWGGVDMQMHSAPLRSGYKWPR